MAIACVVIQLMFVHEFGSSDAARYSAFMQNLLMSVLFISMYAQRQPSEGQSLVIAINKWLGTFAATLIFGVIRHNAFVLSLGLLCFAYDVIYIALLQRREPAEVQRGD
jgi:hypothetical protein